MGVIQYDLKKIKAFIFDVDGVLSCQTVPLSPEGEPLRTANIHDGYALNLAVKCGYGVAIITGGNTRSVLVRYESLGISDIYMKSSIKLNDYRHYLQKTGYRPEEIIFVGDDMPDFRVMREVGLPIAPSDAAPEIRAIAKYISPIKGGQGVARDVIEQVLKVQGRWMGEEAFGW